jgi:hypothetical protein
LNRGNCSATPWVQNALKGQAVCLSTHVPPGTLSLHGCCSVAPQKFANRIPLKVSVAVLISVMLATCRSFSDFNEFRVAGAYRVSKYAKMHDHGTPASVLLLSWKPPVVQYQYSILH